MLREKKYIQSEQIENVLIKNAPLGILMTDKDGVIVYENPYFSEKIVGVPKGKKSKALGTKIQEMPNVIASGITEDIKKLLKGKPIRNLVFPFFSIYKKRSIMSLSGVPLKDPSGKIIGSLMMVNDVTEQKNIESALQQSRENLSVTLKSIGDAVIVTDAKGKITFLNFVAQKLTGWSEKIAIDQPLDKVFNIFNEKTGKKVLNPVLRVVRSGNIVGLGNHTILIDRGGKKISIEDSAAPIRDNNGEIMGVVLVFHDVTENREISKKLEKTSNALRVLSKCNEVLIHINDEQRLLNEICKIIVDFGGYRFAWIGRAENNKKIIGFTAQAGFKKGYLESAKINWIDNKRGPICTAIKTGKAVICNNILTDSRFVPWRATAIKYGYASSISLPFLINDLVETINIYAVEPDAFNENEVRLLNQLANNLSYGIRNIRKSKIIFNAQKSSRDILNFIPDPTLAIDRSGKVIYWNKAIEKMTGVKVKDMIGMGNYEYALPFYGKRRPLLLNFIFNYQKGFEKKYHFIKQDGAVLTTEADVPVRGGKLRTLWAKASPLYDSEGRVIGAIESIRDITDRKAEEQKLKESEGKYKMIVDNVNDAFYLHDFSGKILDVNENACKMTGRTRSELIGANAAIVDVPEQAVFIQDRIRKLIKSDRLLFESQHRRKDGTYFWVSVSAKIVSRENNGLIESFVRDITDQKQSEEKLKESEERYKNLISSLPKTEYVLVHRNGELLWVNDSAVSFLGYSKKEIIGSSVLDYLEKKYQKIVLENINKRSAGEKVGDYEIKIRDSKGEQRDVLVRGSSVSYEGKLATLLVLSDVTDMVKKDEELVSLNNELAKFKLAVDKASDDIIITDSKGMILYANSASEKNNGYSLAEIIGKTPAIWGGQMSKEFYANFWKTIKEDKKSCICEMINKRKNGESYNAEVRVSPIVNNNNEVEFFVGISHDITKLKELDRAKSEFVSVASHQLKTPVAGIKWMLESILKNRENNLTEKQIENLNDIYENNERMISLINDLLNISRIDSGKYALLNLAKAEIAPMIERAIKELDQFANTRKVRVTFQNNLPPNYSINIDYDKIYQAILNLILNSIKYSKFEGGISEITTELKNGEFVFAIKDDGIGIPIRNQRHVFEKFYRAENASNSNAGGSGLGLYIGKYFIESHKGKIWFTSNEGVGTTFYFTLNPNLI